jgi:hypothetical protein
LNPEHIRFTAVKSLSPLAASHKAKIAASDNFWSFVFRIARAKSYSSNAQLSVDYGRRLMSFQSYRSSTKKYQTSFKYNNGCILKALLPIPVYSNLQSFISS